MITIKLLNSTNYSEIPCPEARSVKATEGCVELSDEEGKIVSILYCPSGYLITGLREDLPRLEDFSSPPPATNVIVSELV